MQIVETPVFTDRVLELMGDENYRRLQWALVLRPEQGVLVPGGGGLRKVRWGRPGKGKSGAFRVLYYWNKSEETVFLLFIISKTLQNDLTQDQIKTLSRMIKEDLS